MAFEPLTSDLMLQTPSLVTLRAAQSATPARVTVLCANAALMVAASKPPIAAAFNFIMLVSFQPLVSQTDSLLRPYGADTGAQVELHRSDRLIHATHQTNEGDLSERQPARSRTAQAQRKTA